MSSLIKDFEGTIDSEEWFEWLKTVKSFIYRGEHLHFKVWLTGRGTWRVDKYIQGRTRQIQVGSYSNCTLAKLQEVEKRFVEIDKQIREAVEIQEVLPKRRMGEYKCEYTARALKEIIKAIKDKRKGYKKLYFAQGIRDLKKLGEIVNE